MLGEHFDTLVIILSTGRTGTAALADYFDRAYPQVRALHEPKPSRCLRIASNRHFCGQLSSADMQHRLLASRRHLLASITEPIYIESNSYLHGFLDVFDRLFKNIKIVHVVRDPRTYIRSGINFGTLRGLKWLASNLIPYWNVKPRWHQEKLVRSWADLNEVEWLAWYWTSLNERLDRGRQHYGSNYIRLRFEDLFATNGTTLQSLANWIGLPDEPELTQAIARGKVNASRRTDFPEWPAWLPELQEAVIKQCGTLARTYGYDL